MKYRLSNIHILASLMLTVALLIEVFSTDNPLILFSAFITLVILFVITESTGYIKRGLIYFVPFSLVTVIINFIFVSQGSIVLFTFFQKDFTLEALIYAVIFAFKLLLVIYIFNLLDIMMDSDRAVSYFSGVLPKSTLMLMITFKLFPSLRNRLTGLKEVYSVRGLDFEKKSVKEQIKSYVPVISVLLESSMEDAFDIGEAAYVRGFLSGKRSIYDRQKLNRYDCLFILYIILFILCFTVVKLKALDTFDIYYNFKAAYMMNTGIFIMSAVNLLFAAVIRYISCNVR